MTASITDVVLAIQSGTLDSHFTSITGALRTRQKAITEIKTVEALELLQIGDKVKVASSVSPKKLGGAPGVIMGRDGNQFIVNLDYRVHTSSKRSWKDGIKFPASTLVKAES